MTNKHAILPKVQRDEKIRFCNMFAFLMSFHGIKKIVELRTKVYLITLELWTNITLENHCNRTAQSLHGGCSRRVHKIVYLAVKKGNIFVNILFLKIFIPNYCHL